MAWSGSVDISLVWRGGRVRDGMVTLILAFGFVAGPAVDVAFGDGP